MNPPVRARDIGIMAAFFVCILTIRIWGITSHFWMLHDQIRDWSIALGPFRDLPLVGPPTHVRGYTIGPAFYWILWLIRVTCGPWFQNLPHAGGIGQATLQSGADVLLLVALWRRTQSAWIALTTVVLVTTAAYDLCLSALVWNPAMGTALAKIATALILLDWHRGSAPRLAITAAVAWSAVHAYTGAVFVAVGVFAAMIADPLAQNDRRAASRHALIIAIVVGLLQVPYLIHQLSTGFGDSAMGAVTGSVGRILSGGASPEFAKSTAGLVEAFNFIEVRPWQIAWSAWLLLVCGVLVGIRHWRDVTILAVTILPVGAAVVGYALFLAGLEPYYYLSLMPAVALTVVLAATALPWRTVSRPISIGLCIGALALVPSRLALARTLHRMPEYGVLVEQSRQIVGRGIAMRAIETEFALPPTSDPAFIYRILGGRIDARSPWIGVITNHGVVYRRVET